MYTNIDAIKKLMHYMLKGKKRAKAVPNQILYDSFVLVKIKTH